jgi:hypothetical protein
MHATVGVVPHFVGLVAVAVGRHQSRLDAERLERGREPRRLRWRRERG